MKNRFFAVFLIILSMLLQNVVFAAKIGDVYSDDLELVMADLSEIAYFQGKDAIIENAPYLEGEAFMLPAKYIFENYGYTVTVNNDVLTAEKQDKFVLTKGSADIMQNEAKKTLMTAVDEKNGELFVSHDICDVLGLSCNLTAEGVFTISKSGEFKDLDENILKKLQGIYVSPDGNSAATGTVKDPVNSLEAAKKLAIKHMGEYGKQYPVRIFVMGGTYRFDKGVEFTEDEFSSDVYKGLSIENYDENKPEFTAAIEINAEDFVPVTDPYTLARLHKNGRGKVASIDLRNYGISQMEQLANKFNYLYLDDIEQILARWPNSSEATIFSVPQQNSFTFTETDPTRWTAAKNAYMFGHFSNWEYQWHQGIIQSVDAATKTIKIKGAASNNVLKTTAAGTGWYAMNLLEELDSPGEWFVDTDELKLYYYPPYKLKERKLEMVNYLGTLLTFNNAKNVKIKGINFAKCVQAIRVDGTDIRNVTVEKCDFSHGQERNMVEFPKSARAYNISILENTAYNLFGNFVFFRSGDLRTLTPGNSIVKNNHVIQPAQYYKEAGGLVGMSYQTGNVGDVGVICENNIVQDSPGGAAIGWGGTNCSINNNEIVNAGKVMNDYGAIYVGRSASYMDMEIAHNFLHDFNNDNNYNGLYNDDAFANASWHHNVTVDMYQPCIQAPGMNTEYMYNLAVNCAKPGSIGSRKSYNRVQYKAQDWIDTNDLIFTNEEVYREKYPLMFDWLERDKEWYNVCWDSVYFGNVGVGNAPVNDFVELTEYGAKEIERNGKTISIEGLNGQRAGNPQYDYSDDLFVDPEKQNYNINPESQIAKDFPELLEIDVTKSGLTEDAEYLIEKPQKGSHLKYPGNGQRNLNASSITFSWDPVKGATFYRIIVATDPKLENVIFDEEIRENGNTNEITLDGFANNCVYYWKVVAKSVVRQNQFEIDSIGGPYAFKTALKDTLSKENLRLAITSFETFCNEDLKNPEYEFDAAFVETANKKLAEVKEVYKKAKSQAELDNAEEELYFVLKKSPFYMKLRFENIKGAYDKNAVWEVNKGNIDVDSSGVLTYSSAMDERGEARVKIDNDNTVLCFKMKLADLGTKAGHYQGFDVKLTGAGQGYLIVFKHDIIEWQRINRTLTEIPNDFIEAGKWYDVQAGGINTPNGVLQFFRVDGRIIYAELDQTGDQTREGGYFRIRKNGLGNIQIKDMEQVPADGIIIDDILKDFRTPHSAKHLQTLFIGSADTMEMGSSVLFSKLDKSKLAELVYPVIKSNTVNISRDDITEYKKIIEEMCVVAGYNQGVPENLFKNKIDFLYRDILGIDSIDTNGVTLYAEFSKMNDKYKSITTESMMGSSCKNIDELKLHIAKQMLTGTINACYICFAGQSEYISNVLTKENADYLGIDISDYLALTTEQKLKANDAIGNGRHGDITRTLDVLLEDIHEAVRNVK